LGIGETRINNKPNASPQVGISGINHIEEGKFTTHECEGTEERKPKVERVKEEDEGQ